MRKAQLMETRVLSFLICLCGTFAVHAQTGRLNDTGRVTCANNDSNSIACAYADGDTAGFPRQDGQMGRSAKDYTSGHTLTKTGSSVSEGFDFTATATTPVCTTDNITGLTWERKVTTASNYQRNISTFNWKSTADNGGVQGNTGTATGTSCYGAASCDTAAYVAYANSQSLCGFTNWRLPTRLELMNIVDVAKQNTTNTAADSTFFPNLQHARYWTSENVASNPNFARYVDFATGSDGLSHKTMKYHVILVRP